MPGSLSVPVRLSPGVDSFGMLFSQYSPALQTFGDVMMIVGLLFIGKFAIVTLWDIFVGIRSLFWSRLFKKNFEKRYGGKWAVVTGCTDGIGKAYCQQLAKDGLNLVLISRNRNKLDSVALAIRNKYGVETEVVVADFSVGAYVYPGIEAALKNKDIGMLINNVGIMTSHPKYFDEVSDEEVWGHVNVNVASVAVMTKLVLPQMLARQRGAIINIASIAASGPVPLLGIYSASKAFVEFLSLSTESEYSHVKGLTIQTVTPGYVSTNMTSFSKWAHTPNLFTPTADTFAASAVSSIGYTSYTTGFWSHGILKWCLDKMPRFLYILFMKYQQKFLRSTVTDMHTN